jgi:hypothetical protein
VLTVHALAAHLVAKGLLTHAEVVGGKVSFLDQSRRNCNFQVRIGRSRGYFVKHARTAADTLDTEGEFYRSVRARPLARYVPSLRDYDRDQRLLVLQLFCRGRDLSETLAGRGRISRRVAADLGGAVAAIHQSSGEWLARSAVVPWVLSLPRPSVGLLRDMSAANVEILRIVQQSRVLCRNLESLARSWRPRALIHHDLRLANCVATMERLRIVDWESAGSGEPAWDVGSILADFLAFWVRSMELTVTHGQRLPAHRARISIRRLQPAIRSFWTAYGAEQAEEFLPRAVQFAGARLIQTAVELTDRSSYLTPHAVMLLQLSENILSDPAGAARGLLGLDA